MQVLAGLKPASLSKKPLNWLEWNEFSNYEFLLTNKQRFMLSYSTGSINLFSQYFYTFLLQIMARYRGPRLRIVRRLGELPGFTQKTTSRRPPGEHGRSKDQMKLSQYGLRLQEKQKLRYHFGLTERQLMNYVKRARSLKGPTGELLLGLLEMRLDNVLYRLGLVPTIGAARQFIGHGHVLVNKKKVDIASYQCQPKDVISIRDKKQSKQCIGNFLENKQANTNQIPPHLSLNKEYLVGTINGKIQPEWVGLQVNELLIVEYYSRKI